MNKPLKKIPSIADKGERPLQSPIKLHKHTEKFSLPSHTLEEAEAGTPSWNPSALYF